MKKTSLIALASLVSLSIAVFLVMRSATQQTLTPSPDSLTEVPADGTKMVYDDRQPRAAIRDRGDSNTADPTPANQTNSAKPIETSEWSDPVNQKVLGPKRWMAEPSDEENEAIEAVFEKARKNRDTHVDRASRQHSIDAMRAVVSGCLHEHRITHPDATGRIIVSWTATGGPNGVGKISDVTIDTNVGLRDDAFEMCVRDGENLRFTSDAGDPLRVEYPFMFDEHE